MLLQIVAPLAAGRTSACGVAVTTFVFVEGCNSEAKLQTMLRMTSTLMTRTMICVLLIGLRAEAFLAGCFVLVGIAIFQTLFGNG